MSTEGCPKVQEAGIAAVQRLPLVDRQPPARAARCSPLLLPSKHSTQVSDFGISAFMDNTIAQVCCIVGRRAVSVGLRRLLAGGPPSPSPMPSLPPRPAGPQCHTFLGTVTYMSPERIDGKPYSFPADVWALGLTLLECATGRYPYDASAGTMALMIQVRVLVVVLGWVDERRTVGRGARMAAGLQTSTTLPAALSNPLPAAHGGGVPAAARGRLLARAARLRGAVHAARPVEPAHRGAAAAAPVCGAARVRRKGAGRGGSRAEQFACLLTSCVAWPLTTPLPLRPLPLLPQAAAGRPALLHARLHVQRRRQAGGCGGDSGALACLLGVPPFCCCCHLLPPCQASPFTRQLACVVCPLVCRPAGCTTT